MDKLQLKPLLDSGLYKAYIVQGNASSNGTASTIIESPRQILAGNGIGDINGDGVDDLALSFKEGDGSVTTYAVYGQDGGFGSTINDAYLNTSGNALRIHHNINLGSGEYTIQSVVNNLLFMVKITAIPMIRTQ